MTERASVLIMNVFLLLRGKNEKLRAICFISEAWI